MAINRSVYVVLTIVLVAIAGSIGYFAGQMLIPTKQPTRETITITQKETQTITAQVAQTTRQPTREELLAPIIEAAKKEGKLIIYATFDRPSAEPLLQAFKARYPFIDVEYLYLDNYGLYNRYVSERAAGAPTADILWNTGTAFHLIFIRNGTLQPYRLTIYDRIPEDAKYKDLAYVTSYQLTAPIYNTQKIPKDLAPKSYADLLNLLTQRKDLFPPRSITAFDVANSDYALLSTYYLYKTEPELIQRLWSTAAPIGIVIQRASSPQIELVRSGQAVISLGLTATYAFREAVNDSRIGAFIPNDLVFLNPRLISITREAQHPNAAKLFLEFVMSEEGQDKLAQSAEVIAIGDNKYYPQLSLSYIKANVKKPIIVRLDDPWLEEILKPEIRDSFIAMWKKWLGIG